MAVYVLITYQLPEADLARVRSVSDALVVECPEIQQQALGSAPPL